MDNKVHPPAYQTNSANMEYAQHQQMQQQQQPHDPNSYPMQPMSVHPQQQPQPQLQPQPQQQAMAPQSQYITGPQPMPYQSLQTASMPVWCPQCHKVVNSVTTFQAGGFTHAIAAVLCCTTWCCCWIPYVFNGLQDVIHKCPTCPTTFAIFHRSGRTEVMVTPQQSVPPPQQQQQQQQPPVAHQ